MSLSDDEIKRYQFIYQTERDVLGMVFYSQVRREENYFHRIMHLKKEDFMEEKHQKIFAIMDTVNRNNIPITPITVYEESLKNTDNKLELSDLISMFADVPTCETIDHYTDIIIKDSNRRKALVVLDKFKDLIFHFEVFDDHNDFVGEMYKIVEQYDNKTESKGLLKDMETASDLMIKRLNQKDRYLKTGFHQYDTVMGGLGRGWLYILSANTGVGKTARALCYSLGVARNNPNAHVLYFSQEMKSEELLMRLVANVRGIYYGTMTRGQVSDKDMEHIKQAIEQIKKYNIFIYDIGNAGIINIKAIVKKHKRKHKEVSLVVVDYITILDIEQKKGETWSKAVGHVSRNLKNLAMSEDCCVMALSQLSRQSEKGVPQLKHLRDSGEIEQDSDVVEFLHEEEEKSTEAEGDYIVSTIAKGRSTGLAEFKLRFKKWFQRFEEIKITK